GDADAQATDGLETLPLKERVFDGVDALELEHAMRPEADLVADRQPLTADALAVHERPVAAVEVLDLETAVGPGATRVHARHLRVVEHDGGDRRAAERHRAFDLEAPPLERPLD